MYVGGNAEVEDAQDRGCKELVGLVSLLWHRR